MMKKLIYLSVAPLLLNASLLDFQILEEAKRAYEEGNYSKTLNAYERLERKSDEVKYDEANSYYKLKEYKKALALYGVLTKPELAFEKWHNSGNCHAQLGALEEGIKAYEEALKIRDDKDTKFNLELLKKKKKEKEQQKKQNKNDQKKNDKNQKDKDSKKEDAKDKKNSKDQKKSDKEKPSEQDKKSEEQKKAEKEKKTEKEKKAEKEKKTEKEKKAEEKRKQEEAKKKSEDQKNQNAKGTQAQVKKEPISEKELRKYQKMLDQRGINTLMVPLETKGEKSNENKPW